MSKKTLLLFLSASIALVASKPTLTSSPIHLPLHALIGKRSSSSEIALTNDLDLGEVAVKVKVGTPAQEFMLLFDTGSADTWVPSQQCTSKTGCPDFLNHYEPASSSSYKELDNDALNITYGIGSADGHYFQDVVSLGGDYTNKKQILASIDKAVGSISTQNKASDVDHVFLDGIFGAGLPGGTMRSLQGGDPYDPLIVALYKSKTIPKPVFSVFIAQGDAQGSVILGGVHSGYDYLYTSALGARWSAYVTEFQLEKANTTKNFKFNQKTAFGIDTGSNFMYLPVPLATELAKEITEGGELTQEESGLYVVDCKLQQSPNFVKVFFPSSDKVGKSMFVSIPVKELVSKRETDNKCLLLFVPSTDKFILGNMFLRHFVTVYDFTDDTPRIGFAPVKL